MKLTAFTDASAFRDLAWPLLLQREAENNLMIGIVGRLAEGALPGMVGGAGRPRFWLIEDGAQVAAAVITPPHRLILTRLPSDSAEWLARELRGANTDLPGVMGPKESADQFASAWCAARSCVRRPQHALRLYQLDQVQPIAPVPGDLAVAQADDLELLHQWIDGFRADTGVRERPTVQILRGQIITGSRFLWKSPDPVCMAGLAGPTPNGIRIGAVYTPPEHRRRGYASALVAAVSQRQLDAGRKFCFLFTDLANPTSNSIYQKIGYQPVCDFQEYDFTPA